VEDAHVQRWRGLFKSHGGAVPTHTPSLRTRLLAWLLAGTVVAALAQAGFAYATALAQADVIFDRHLRTMAMALTSGTSLGSLPPSGEINADRAGEDFVVQLWNARGEPIFRTAAHQKLRQPAQPGFSIVHALDGRDYRVYSAVATGLTVLVAQDMEPAARWRARWRCAPRCPSCPPPRCWPCSCGGWSAARWRRSRGCARRWPRARSTSSRR
jgi:hypothetical protein